jgi:hypothetical protein
MTNKILLDGGIIRHNATAHDGKRADVDRPTCTRTGSPKLQTALFAFAADKSQVTTPN